MFKDILVLFAMILFVFLCFCKYIFHPFLLFKIFENFLENAPKWGEIRIVNDRRIQTRSKSNYTKVSLNNSLIE